MALPRDRTIPLALSARREVEVEATLVANAFGLGIEEFRHLMDARLITLLCERGTGEDAGTLRASFYHGQRRVRLLLDDAGTLLPEGLRVDGLAMPAGARRPGTGGPARG